MHLRLTKEGRNARNTVLKVALWTTGATIVVRGCVGACNDAAMRSVAAQQASQAAAQPAQTTDPQASYPWAHVPLGSTLSGPWHNTSGEATVLYIDGVRTIILDGDLVTITGVVVYDRRYKCKALRVESQDSSGKLKPVYFPLSKPTPASFWDCTPEE
jgi:hypothetical protein